jgi:long-subunit acyl-CoA synthetase (AMP-forming)
MDPSTPPGAGAVTLCEAFQRAVAHAPDEIALRAYGRATELTWRDFANAVRAAAEGLASLGVARGDTVAMMTRNIPELVIADAAALHLGATPFSIYPTSTPEQVAYLVADADSRVVLYEPQFAPALTGIDPPECPHRITVDGVAGPSEITFYELLRQTSPGFDFDATWRAVRPCDIAALLYTSGTTGPPKGVQATHASILATLDCLSRALPYPVAGHVVSYLPFAHIGDRIASYYPALYCAHTLTTVPEMADVLVAVREARPTQWSAVPRVWEKLMAGLQSRGITPETMSKAKRSEVRASLGFDRARWLASGAAPLSGDVLDYFGRLGLPICDTWGMSECGIGAVNPIDDIRPGTVGRVLPGLEYTLLPDGELLLRGPTVMAGYRKNPEATRQAIDAEGWLHTGDIATADADGYLTILDRKKELIISAGGKNMSPANIERQIKAASTLIGQACVIGDRRPYNTALLVLDPEVSAAFAAAHGLANAELGPLSTDPVVQRHLEGAVADANSRLSRVEQVKKFAVLPVEWAPSSDELTPTMKLRRREISRKYADVIESLYAPVTDSGATQAARMR